MGVRAVQMGWVILGVLAASASARAAERDSFRIDVPELVGPMPDYGSAGGRTLGFDFGQRFSEVHRLLLVIEATGTPGSYEHCGSLSEPAPCETVAIDPSLMAVLLGQPYPARIAVLDGFPSDVPVSRADAFQSRCCEFDLSDLEDGAGGFVFEWNQIYFLASDIITNFVPPTAEIFEATLIIEATPLPEPRADLAGACCLVVLGSLRSRFACASRRA